MAANVWRYGQMVSGLPSHVRLQEGERVLHVMRPWRLIVCWKYFLSLGLYHFWWKRDVVALTTTRVVATRGFIFSKFDRSLPLGRLQDVSRKRRLFWAYLAFSTAGGEFGKVRWGPYLPSTAREFAADAYDGLHSAQTTTAIRSAV
jgi:hypothetical protein